MKKIISLIFLIILVTNFSMSFTARGGNQGKKSTFPIIESVEVIDSNQLLIIIKDAKKNNIKNFEKQVLLRDNDNSKLDIKSVTHESTNAGEIHIILHLLEPLKVDKEYSLKYRNEFFRFLGKIKNLEYFTVDGVLMLDSRHIKIYFPEAMDKTSVENIKAYDIKSLPEDTIAQVTYDSESNTEIVDISDSYDSQISKDDFIIRYSETIKVFNESQNKVLANSNGEDLTIEFAIISEPLAYIDDVFTVMLDQKHMKVFFPEAMDERTVENLNAYGLKSLSDDFITKVDYDSENKTAVISLSDAYEKTITTDFLIIYNSETTKVLNENQTKEVANLSGEDLFIEFAISSREADGPILESASYNAINNQMTLHFDQYIQLKDQMLLDEAIVIKNENRDILIYELVEIKEKSIVVGFENKLISNQVIGIIILASDVIYNPYTFEGVEENEFYIAIP